MSIEKREGKTETQNPVRSSVWFGNPNFIDSKISGPTLSEKRADGPSGHCARNISDGPTKHTKTNPQRPGECAWSPKPTGGNRVNRGSIPSPLPPWPPVQNSSVACLRRTIKLSDRSSDMSKPETPRQNPK